MTTATAAKSARIERCFSVERLGNRFALSFLNPMGQVRFELTSAQAQALVDDLVAELRRGPSQPQEEDWRDPEIM